MKKLFFILITVLLVQISFAQVKGTFSTQLDNYQFSKNGVYDIIQNDNAFYTEQVGAPKLPVFYQKYVLPAGSVVTNINSNATSKSQLKGSYYIMPSQPPCPTTGEPCPDFVAPDLKVYNSKSTYPKKIVEIVNNNYTLGYHIVTVKITPFEYLPASRELKLNTQINFTINYSVGKIALTNQISKKRFLLNRSLIKAIIKNPTDLKSINQTASKLTTSNTTTDKLVFHFKPSNYGDMPDYIIITDETLKPYFETLATYKTQKGIPTMVVTTAQIYNEYAGVDNAEKIRNYIKAAHHFWGDGLFILLGGDTAIIPERFGTREYYSGTNYYRTTDMYYCDVSKPNEPNYNWNSDGDADFGWDTAIELGADNFIGRAPVDTTAEALNFVNKIISYENLTNVSSTDYVNNLLFIGAYGKVSPYYNDKGQEWHTQLYNQSYFNNVPYVNKWLLFDDHNGSSPHNYKTTINGINTGEELDKATVLNRLNNGHPLNNKNFHLISHFDHGGPYGIGMSGLMKGDGFNRSDLDGLSNGSYYQIFYTGSCDTGEFEKDCIAEHYVNATNGGGVAMFANSGFGWFSSNAQPQALFRSVYETQNGHILGLASQATKYFINSQNKIKNLALFGEPSMEIWTNTPQQISLTVPSSINIQNNINNTLTVNINALTENALVTLYKQNATTNQIEVYATQVINAGNTSTNFIINPDTQGNILTKVTAKNYLPATANTSISLPQAHLYITQKTFNDANGNGLIEQGETISLDIRLTNSGNTAIDNITATLASNTFANVTNAQISHAAPVNPGNSIDLVGFTFDMLITEEAPAFVEFSLDITGSNNFSHTDTFYLDLKNSQIELSNRSLIDSNDQVIVGDLPVNETIQLYVDLFNSGSIEEQGITASLTSTLSTISITENTSTYPNILNGNTSTNNTAFEFEVLQSGLTSIPFTLTITNGFGKTWNYDFDVLEDLPPLIQGFDFTSKKEEIILTWNPVANIKGYNLYRSDTMDGVYTKINNNLVTGSAMYSDTEVAQLSKYFYKISVVTLSGNELPKAQLLTTDNQNGYLAWTSLDKLTGFPIIPESSAASSTDSSPTIFDVDNDGDKELFLNCRNAGSSYGQGRIMAFEHSGQELYDIDGNATEIWGFAATPERLDGAKPAIGDIDNDGIAEIFSTGRNSGANIGMLYNYKNRDSNNDNKPDFLWNNGVSVGHRTSYNPVLADINNDGFMEIIVLDEFQRISVYDKDGNVLGRKRISGGDWSEGQLAVADIDKDGFKEIIMGVKANSNNKGAIYKWNPDNNYNTELELVKEFNTGERADSGIVLADIDNDSDYEILTVTRQGSTGRLYALNLDGTFVNSNNWNGSISFSLITGAYKDHVIPRVAVGDINDDGILEVAFNSLNQLFVLDNNGNNLAGFPIATANSGSFSPVLADIDSDDDIEIIVNADGKLLAFNNDGTECIGWRLESESSSKLVGTPAISDIDNDGFNEVVISTKDCSLYVWKTTGDSDKIEWGSYRANAQNTATYLNSECNYDSPQSIHITGTNVIWNTDKQIQGDLVIETGANLTITSSVSFTSGSEIIIEKGAKLSLDGGTLTNNCNNLWKGIDVLGDSTHPNDTNYQGVLELKNDATIENALYAIRIGKSEHGHYIAGGKLSIVKSNLINNVGAVKVYATTSALNPNQILIKNSVFITNNDLYSILHPKTFISVSSAKNVTIYSNTFKNNASFSSQTAYIYNKRRGAGIYSFHSRIRVKGNDFKSLYSGVKVREVFSNYNIVDIKKNSFIKNYNAVSLNNSSATVTSNKIHIPRIAYLDGTIKPSGIYIINSRGFHIEDNDIYAKEVFNSNGIFIRDCATTNLIYRNRFYMLGTAIYAMGRNTYDNTDKGLQIQCNTFRKNKTDIYVAPRSTIATLQGREKLSAGNTFNPLCESDSNNEINNNSHYQINYFGEEPPQYMPYCSNDVNLFRTVHNSCPSRLNGISATIVSLNRKINSNKSTLNSITDGGNTEVLNESIDEAKTDEAIILRNKLLDKSPFLSDTVMINSVSKENVLPAIMLKQVLAANPKAAKSNKVQKALDERENKLPNYMRNEINLGKNKLSYKEEVESNLSSNINLKESLIDSKINNYLRDTISPIQASIEIKNILSNEALTEVDRNYDLVEYYISKRDIKNAESTFNNIFKNFVLTENQQRKYKQLAQLFNINKDIIKNGKSWFDVNSKQLNIIHKLSIDSTSTSGMQARAVLSLIEDKDYGFPIPDKVNIAKNGFQAETTAPKFNVFPKKADNYFIIDYTLNNKENVEDVKFSIFDDFGKKITTKVIITKQNQLIVECSKWLEGIYWCKKIVNGFSVDKKQILLLRNNSEEDFSKYFNVYPNPTDKYFNIKLSKNRYKNTNIQITDIRGITIKNIKNANTRSNLKIDTSNWQSGVYFVSLFNDGNIVETVKLIIK